MVGLVGEVLVDVAPARRLAGLQAAAVAAICLAFGALLFLATLAFWLRDDSSNQARTREFLRHRLAGADRLMVRAWGKAAPPGVAA